MLYLNNHSCYSFRYGIMSPEELLAEAAQRGVKILALTDVNHTGACQDFVRLAPKYNIRPVVGADVRNTNNQRCFILLARNNDGFREINDFLSEHKHTKMPFPVRAPHFEQVEVIYPFGKFQRGELLEDETKFPERGKALQPYEWIGINQADLNKLPLSKVVIPKDRLVIRHTVTFRKKLDFNAHRLLRSIDTNELLSKLPKAEEGKEWDIFLTQEEFRAAYGRYDEVIRNTYELLEGCHVHFLFKDNGDNKNQKYYTGGYKSDYLRVRQLCDEGLRYRYPTVSAEVRARLDKELTVISEQGFLSYFLINQRITEYARHKGYFYVGRGSGANSIVAYLLRITDVDPIELDLYFERFINLYRKSPPDFDIDFSWKDREDVTRFIFEEFDHVALLGAYSTFQQRAVLRELGKVFGLPARDIDKVQNDEIRYEQLDSMCQLVRRYSKLLHGLPSHLTIHSCGILISERPIHNYTATELPPKGFPTTQFDMLVAEDVGLFKFDILGQRGLSKIEDSMAAVKQNYPQAELPDIHNINLFVQDEAIKKLLRNGKTMGCFYVESPAMRQLLKKLRVDHYSGLVAASSVIRPGVSKSGMMREYILRFRDPKRRKEAHPVMLEIMPDTFGIMVYQEDVIKVAHHFGGLTLGESDVLRRGMSGKYRSREEFQAVKDKFFSSAAAKGREPAVIKEVWTQIESFAGYAFAKGHSASYAVESYQSLYFKAHYPLEYMVATINNGGGFYSWETYLHEARMDGAEVERPCVNRSLAEATLDGKLLFIGLSAIKGLEQKSIAAVLRTRAAEGLFTSLLDFVERTKMSLEQVELLLRLDAFRFTGKTKKALFWEAQFLLGNSKKKAQTEQLFSAPPKSFALPELPSDPFEDAFDEMDLLGFPLCSPFDLMRNPLPPHMGAAELEKQIGQAVLTFGYLVNIKRTRTYKGDRMYFGTFLDRCGAFIDTVHFPDVNDKYPFRGKGIYRIIGKVIEEFDCISIEVTALYKESFIDDPRFTSKQDQVKAKFGNVR